MVAYSHLNCQAANLDPHYSQQNSAATGRNGSAAALEQESSRYRGTVKTYILGRCDMPGSALGLQLEQQRTCNRGLVQWAVGQLRGRSLIFLGDSLMFQQWMSTLTMMAFFLTNLQCPSLRSVYKSGWNAILPFTCAQTSDWAPGVAGLRLCYAHRHPFHSNLAKTMRMLHRQWTAKDIMVMNSGMWHGDYFDLTKNTVEGVLDYASRNNNSVPSLFWRETSPQHFAVPYSAHECLDPPTCSRRNTTAPMRSSLPQCVPCSEADWKGCITAKRHNEVARAVLAGRHGAMKLVRIWNTTVLDWQSHLGFIANRDNVAQLDCSHYCLPSPTVNSWTLELFAEWRQGQVHHSC